MELVRTNGRAIERGDEERGKRKVRREREEEADTEKRPCVVRNGTVDRCGVIQIGCDRRNPRLEAINFHRARSSPTHDSGSISARGGWFSCGALTRCTVFRVAVGNDDIAWEFGSS